MTMVICRECKAHISTLAAACLHCGATKRRTTNSTTVGIAFLGVTLLGNTWMLWRLHEVESLILQGGGMAQGVRGSQ